MEDPAADRQWMSRALALARQGVGLASPNPTVGCVLVRDGAMVGEGFHRYEDRDHAEIVALKQARDDARGSTAYVTLEPCSHFGRTGPCVEALMRAGVARVVGATVDPNPAVAGSGLEFLRRHSIQVEVGLLEADAREINDSFAHFIRHRTPLVSLKIAATLDGAIAPPRSIHADRKSFAITGAAAHLRVQELRHAHDALLTGIGTVLADDPLLTDRSSRPRRRRLLRVLLDSKLRLPLDSRILENVNEDLLVITRNEDAARQRALIERGAHVLVLESQGHEDLPLQPLLRRLGEQEITSVLVEAGGRINRSVLADNLADKLYFFQAPRFLGPDAVPMLAGSAATAMPRLLRYRTERMDEDLLIEGYLRDPWEMPASSSL